MARPSGSAPRYRRDEGHTRPRRACRWSCAPASFRALWPASDSAQRPAPPASCAFGLVKPDLKSLSRPPRRAQVMRAPTPPCPQTLSGGTEALIKARLRQGADSRHARTTRVRVIAPRSHPPPAAPGLGIGVPQITARAPRSTSARHAPWQIRHPRHCRRRYVKYSGDIVKALAAGARVVMMALHARRL